MSPRPLRLVYVNSNEKMPRSNERWPQARPSSTERPAPRDVRLALNLGRLRIVDPELADAIEVLVETTIE